MNAILLCAGIGKRFRPISYLTPKSLVPVNGVPYVEQIIQMLRRNDIDKITLIRGYMPEKFEYLQKKYDVEFLYNPRYLELNNHSSLLLAADRLDGSMVIDGDLLFVKDVIHRIEPGKSQFVTQKTIHGLEWEMNMDATGRIVNVTKWTPSGYSMTGLSYWEGEAAAMLGEELTRSHPDDYWEDAVLRILHKTPIYATCIEETFLMETDTIKDALELNLLTHEEVASLSSLDFKPVRLKGLTNSTWQIQDHTGVMRCLRIPGHGTDAFIQREEEPKVVAAIRDLDVTPETEFFPGGLKTTRFLEGHRDAVARDLEKKFFVQLVARLNRINSIPYDPKHGLEPMLICAQIAKFEALTDSKVTPEERDWLWDKASRFDSEPLALCHRDLALENLLVAGDHGEDLYIIDFEYAGFAHPIWEYASFILESGMDDEARLLFAETCGLTTEEDMRRLYEMEILVDYVWGMWGAVLNYHDYSAIKIKRLTRKLRAIRS